MKSLAAVVLVCWVVACQRVKEAPEAAFDTAAGLARTRAARAELVRAWDALDGLRSELAALAGAPRPSAQQLARRSELERRLAEAEKAFDAAYQGDQAALAGFLNQALNVAPAAPETRQALDLYAESAERNARDFIRYAGDYRRAVELLDTAQGYYTSVGLQAPATLVEAVRAAREYRVLTRTRFDRLVVGMTEEQARVYSGVPYHANVRHSQVAGKPVTSWLFGCEDGGVAALYFSSGKLYALRWNIREGAAAVQPRPAS